MGDHSRSTSLEYWILRFCVMHATHGNGKRIMEASCSVNGASHLICVWFMCELNSICPGWHKSVTEHLCNERLCNVFYSSTMHHRRSQGVQVHPSGRWEKIFCRQFLLKWGKNEVNLARCTPCRWDIGGIYNGYDDAKGDDWKKKGHEIFGEEKCTPTEKILATPMPCTQVTNTYHLCPRAYVILCCV